MEMLLEDCWVLGRKVSSCSRLSGIYLFFFFLKLDDKVLGGASRDRIVRKLCNLLQQPPLHYFLLIIYIKLVLPLDFSSPFPSQVYTLPVDQSLPLHVSSPADGLG